MLTAVHAARPTTTVSYDPNLRPALLGPPGEERARVEELVRAADVVKASEEDLGWLYPGHDLQAIAARWARNGPALVVLTLGDGGARAFWRHGSEPIAPVPVTVTDTVGAGDAFMAGLLIGLLDAGLLGRNPGIDEPFGAGLPEAGPLGPRARLAAATCGEHLSESVRAALALAARVAAITCTRPGADPPTRAELAAGA